MKTKTFISTLALATVVLLTSCAKDDPTKNVDNPNGIPSQSTVQAKVELAGTADFALLAGSAITSTGATNITGNMGLSPGTSIGGFPPGILVGSREINTN